MSSSAAALAASSPAAALDTHAGSTRLLRLTDADAWEARAEAWDDGARSAGAFYLSYAWLRPWWEAFGKPPLDLMLVAEAGRTLALAPLSRARRLWWGVPVRCVTNLFNPHAARSDISVGGDERRCTQLLLDVLDRRAWDVLFLREIPRQSAFLAQLEALAPARGLRIRQRHSLDSPWLPIQGRWEDFHAKLPSAFRSDLRRKFNRLAASGKQAVFECTTSPERIAAQMPEIMGLALRSWSGQQGTSIGSGRNRAFYEQAFALMARRGALRLFTLRLDAVLAAFDVQIAWGRTLIGLKRSYDPEFAALSPGSLLEAHVMQTQFRSGEFDRLDLLGKDDAFKRRWTDQVESHVEVFVFNRRPASRVVEGLEFGLRPHLGSLKRSLLKLKPQTGTTARVG